MRKIINGLLFDTTTATYICKLECDANPRDFSYHNTALYRTKNGRYFVAGEGGAASMWRKRQGDSWGWGSGIRELTASEARNYAEEADLPPEEMLAAGFEFEEA